MRKLTTVAGLLFCSFVYASDHATQVLHPYWGDAKGFALYMKDLKDPVNGYVTTYDGRKDEDYGAITHLYFYAIDVPGATEFTLDVGCPENQYEMEFRGIPRPEGARLANFSTPEADPVRKNPAPSFTGKNEILWPLDPSGGKQGMWVYSDAKVVERAYTVKVLGPKGTSRIIKGTVSGPSCVLELTNSN